MTRLLIATGTHGGLLQLSSPNFATTTGGQNNYLISALDQGNTLQSTTADQSSMH